MYSVLIHEACLHVPWQRGERGGNDNEAALRVARYLGIRYPRHGRPIELILASALRTLDSAPPPGPSGLEGGELGESGPRSSVDVLSKSSDEWRSTGGLCCSLWLAVSWRGRCWVGLLPIPNTGGTIMTRVYPSPLRVLHRRQTAPLVGTVALSPAPLPLPLPHPSPSSPSSPPLPPRRRLPLVAVLRACDCASPQPCPCQRAPSGPLSAAALNLPALCLPLPLPLPSTSLRPVRGRSSLSD
jgi:hypothetical protein